MVTGTVSQVAQPVFARIVDDNERQRRVFGKILRFTAFMSLPTMFGLSLVAPQVILLTIGSQWEHSIPLLQILCLSGAFLPFYTVYQHMVLSLGKSNIYMWLNVIQLLLVLIAVLACHSLGITAMVIAFVCINILWLLAWQWFAKRLIGYSYVNLLRDLLPFVLITVAILAVTYFVTLPLTNLVALLVARVVIAGLLYALAMRTLHVKIFDECVDFIRSRMKK